MLWIKYKDRKKTPNFYLASSFDFTQNSGESFHPTTESLPLSSSPLQIETIKYGLSEDEESALHPIKVEEAKTAKDTLGKPKDASAKLQKSKDSFYGGHVQTERSHPGRTDDAISMVRHVNSKIEHKHDIDDLDTDARHNGGYEEEHQYDDDDFESSQSEDEDKPKFEGIREEEAKRVDDNDPDARHCVNPNIHIIDNEGHSLKTRLQSASQSIIPLHFDEDDYDPDARHHEYPGSHGVDQDKDDDDGDYDPDARHHEYPGSHGVGQDKEDDDDYDPDARHHEYPGSHGVDQDKDDDDDDGDYDPDARHHKYPGSHGVEEWDSEVTSNRHHRRHYKGHHHPKSHHSTHHLKSGPSKKSVRGSSESVVSRKSLASKKSIKSKKEKLDIITMRSAIIDEIEEHIQKLM